MKAKPIAPAGSAESRGAESASLVGAAEVIARCGELGCVGSGVALVFCVGGGVISGALAESWRPFAAFGIRVGGSGKWVGVRSAVGCVVPEGERSNALNWHREITGGGSLGT